ncbi:hypothetical protein BC826DRAFT_42595 [Russula brevipes]|nr:hypothetical protein BC826DRAFT_42595 [Russula brevipes]
MKQLFDPTSKPHPAVWLWIRDLEMPYRTGTAMPSPPRGTSLHYVTLCGLHTMLKLLVTGHSQDVRSRAFTDMCNRGDNPVIPWRLLEDPSDVQEGRHFFLSSDSLTLNDVMRSPGNAGHSPYVRPHPHKFSHAQVLSDAFPVSATCVIIHARGSNNANSPSTTGPSARPRPHLDGASGPQALDSAHANVTAVLVILGP